jgi:type II secretory pathway pseudopilin PulG
MGHDVFISYSNKDKTVADAVCAMLEQSKVRCWIAPRDIDAGSEWGESIIEGINNSRVMVLVFSKSANESPQIRREVERAVNKGIIIVPFRIEDVIPTKSLEYFIGAVHWLDALTPPIEHHLEKLAANIRRIVFDEGPRNPEPNPPGRRESGSIATGGGVAAAVESVDVRAAKESAQEMESSGTSGKAIGSLVCGLFFLLFPAAVGAVVLGHIARGEIRRSGGRLKGAKMALAGLILGYSGVVLVPLALILAIAIPNMLNMRVAANEAVARGALKTLNTAVLTYELSYGKLPPNLKSLGPQAPGKSDSADAASLIDAELAAGTKSGYKFTYEVISGTSNYKIKAVPLVPGKTGLRYMSVDRSGEVQFSYTPDNP